MNPSSPSMPRSQALGPNPSITSQTTLADSETTAAASAPDVPVDPDEIMVHNQRQITLRDVSNVFVSNKDLLQLKGPFDPEKDLPQEEGKARKKQKEVLAMLDAHVEEAQDYARHLSGLGRSAVTRESSDPIPSNPAFAAGVVQSDVDKISKIRDDYKILFHIGVANGANRPALEERKALAEQIRSQTHELMEELFPELFHSANRRESMASITRTLTGRSGGGGDNKCIVS